MNEPINLVIIDGTLRGAWDERFDGRGEPVIYSQLHFDQNNKDCYFDITILGPAAKQWLGRRPKNIRMHCVGRLAVQFRKLHPAEKYSPSISSLVVEITEMEAIRD